MLRTLARYIRPLSTRQHRQTRGTDRRTAQSTEEEAPMTDKEPDPNCPCRRVIADPSIPQNNQSRRSSATSLAQKEAKGAATSSTADLSLTGSTSDGTASAGSKTADVSASNSSSALDHHSGPAAKINLDVRFCMLCGGILRPIASLEHSRQTAVAQLTETKSKMYNLEQRYLAAAADAGRLRTKNSELDLVVIGKDQEIESMRADLDRIGQKLVDEVELRAELQHGKDALQEEIEDLTKSLFEEANSMVADEAKQRHYHEQREKALRKRVDELNSLLETERNQLRELKTVMELMDQEQNVLKDRLRIAGLDTSVDSPVVSVPKKKQLPAIPDTPKDTKPRTPVKAVSATVVELTSTSMSTSTSTSTPVEKSTEASTPELEKPKSTPGSEPEEADNNPKE